MKRFLANLNRPVKDVVVVTGLAMGFVVFGFFWLVVLMSGAWALAAIFGGLGCVSAFLGLRYPQSSGNRLFLLLTATAGVGVFVLAVLDGTGYLH